MQANKEISLLSLLHPLRLRLRSGLTRRFPHRKRAPGPSSWMAGSRPVIDLREEDAFVAERCASWISIPLSQLRERNMEFPPRQTPVTAVLPQPLHLLSPETLELLRPLSIAETIMPDEAFWATNAPQVVRSAPIDCRLRAWSASSVVDLVPRGSAVLDVGSGTGRNAVHLALERDCTVLCIDNRKPVVDKLLRFASRCGVRDRIEGAATDISRWASSQVAAGGACRLFDVILMARFFHPRFLATATASLLAPGGRLIIEHFTEGCHHPANVITRESVMGLLQAHFVLAEERQAVAEDGRPLLHLDLRRV